MERFKAMYICSHIHLFCLGSSAGCQGILPPCRWHNFPPSSGMTWVLPELFLTPFFLIPCCSTGIFCPSWGTLWDGCGTQLCPAVGWSELTGMTCSWHGAAPVCHAAPWYLGRVFLQQQNISLCCILWLFWKTSSEKGICPFSLGHWWQSGRNQRGGTRALHISCASPPLHKVSLRLCMVWVSAEWHGNTEIFQG